MPQYVSPAESVSVHHCFVSYSETTYNVLPVTVLAQYLPLDSIHLVSPAASLLRNESDLPDN